MELEAFKQNRYVRNLIRDQWLVLGTMGIVVAFAVFYTLVMYQPVFQSEAKVWIKDTGSESYVLDMPGESQLKPLTTAGNPVLTQIQILQSNEMKDALADFIQAKRSRQTGVPVSELSPVDTSDILSVRTEPGTDIITLRVTWSDPKTAQQLMRTALNKYEDINLNINRKIRTQKREYIDQRVAEIEAKLVATRNRIRDFQMNSGAIDLEEQTKELVRLKTLLTSRYADAMAARNNSASSYADLQGLLAMNPRDALKAVALGSGNENLVKMRTTLNELKQQYAHDSIRNADSNPKMVALKNQIDALEKQIAAEVRQTIGNGKAKLHIYDPVRENLVEQMANTRAQARGHGSEAATLSAAIANIDAALKNIPQSKFLLDNLMQEERALAGAYDELRKRQIEARIKEAETPSNIYVVDAPTLPKNASFPTAKHLLVLSGLLGLMAGLGLSALKTYTEDLCEGAESVEQATGARVLGVIPWFRSPVAGQPGDGKNVVPINDLSYKSIVSNLRLQCERRDAGVITFTSSALHKSTVSTSYTLAYRLARLGHSVAMIDADFRSSSLSQNATVTQMGQDLVEMILDVEGKLRRGEPVFAEDIIHNMTLDSHGIFLALNRHDMEHAYDYFASRGFRHIVRTLKERFDWVLIDAPSAALAPEFLAIADMSDGVVLFVDRRATFSTLRKIARRIEETNAPLIGSIIRDQNPALEREHRVYADWNDRFKGGGGLPETAGTVPANRRIEFMGAKIDAMSMDETVNRIVEAIDQRQPLQHVVVNVAKLMAMHRNPELKEIVNNAGLVNADGAGVVWGARLLGHEVPERVAGIDLMQRLVQEANQRGYRIFFLGAEESVVRDVVATYKRRFPSLQICGYRNGYFRPANELAVVKQIRDARPDILFVAMSSPKKERFVKQYMDAMGVPFVMGVGGSFDVVAGKTKRAPLWMQQAGLEWFYRFMQEPGRMWKRYLVTNSEYVWRLLGEAVTLRLRPATHG